MVQRRDEILLDNALTSSEKRPSEVDRSFISLSKKAEDALGSNYTLAGGEKALAMARSVNPNSNPNHHHHHHLFASGQDRPC